MTVEEYLEKQALIGFFKPSPITTVGTLTVITDPKVLERIAALEAEVAVLKALATPITIYPYVPAQQPWGLPQTILTSNGGISTTVNCGDTYPNGSKVYTGQSNPMNSRVIPKWGGLSLEEASKVKQDWNS